MTNPSNPPVDREALHRYLWERANRHHRIRIRQTDLGDALNVTRETVNRVLKEMERGGRVKKVSALPGNVGVYRIFDPDDFTTPDGQPQPKVEPAPRRIMWG